MLSHYREPLFPSSLLPEMPQSLRKLKLPNILILCGNTLEIWPRTTYAEFYKLPDLAESPAQAKREKLPPSTRGRIIQFEREALKFCGEKLNIAILKTSGIFQGELTVRAFHSSRDI